MAYLDDHPNHRLAQQRARRDRPSGLIVVHTAESMLDEIREDTGAEGVARFISERDSYGSYHVLVDSDSIVQVARFEMATYGDGTGSNDFAIHISFACRAADWPGMDLDRRDAYLANGAKAAARAAKWLDDTHGIAVPAERISRAASDQRRPGFISHGERDPGRRTDPGSGFPWLLFLDAYADHLEDDMFSDDDRARLERIETALHRKVGRTNTRLARANTLLRDLRDRDTVTGADLDEALAELEAALEDES